MINFIKRAVAKEINPTNIGMYNGIVCIIYTMLEQDLKNTELSFDLVKIARYIKRLLLENNEDKLIQNFSPLDYADYYSTILGGNSILFLKNYQTYLGQLE
jgi:hypothetical protein